MSEEWGFAPPFKPGEALQRLKRDLRELKLSERSGVWERGAQAIARARVEGDELIAERVRKPARSPDWQVRRLRSSADVRDFVADLKKQLTQWSDADD